MTQPTQLDRADSRVRHDAGIAGALRGFVDQVRSGDLGMLPVIVGLVIISTVFTVLNPVFLAPNPSFDCCSTGAPKSTNAARASLARSRR